MLALVIGTVGCGEDFSCISGCWEEAKEENGGKNQEEGRLGEGRKGEDMRMEEAAALRLEVHGIL